MFVKIYKRYTNHFCAYLFYLEFLTSFDYWAVFSDITFFCYKKAMFNKDKYFYEETPFPLDVHEV